MISHRDSLSAIALATLALLSAVGPLSTDMSLPSFPGIAKDLCTTSANVQLMITTFLTGIACGQLIIGPLSDQYGRRRPLLIGTAVCAASCLVCMWAPNVEVLVTTRFVQGFCGAAGVVLARAIIADRSSNRNEAARYIQIMMGISALAPILAPSIGVGILYLTNWRGVFAMLAFLSTVAIVGSIWSLQESLPLEKRHPEGVGKLASNIAKVARNGRYLGYTLTAGSTFMALFSYISTSSFVMQGVFGLSPAEYALVFGMNAVGLTSGNILSARMVRRFGPVRLTACALVSLLMFTFLLTYSAIQGVSAWLFLMMLFGSVASIGCVIGNACALAVSEVKVSAGTGSAVLGALQFALGALASFVVGLAGKASPVPMAIAMFASALISTAFFWVASKGRREE